MFYIRDDHGANHTTRSPLPIVASRQALRDLLSSRRGAVSPAESAHCAPGRPPRTAAWPPPRSSSGRTPAVIDEVVRVHLGQNSSATRAQCSAAGRSRLRQSKHGQHFGWLVEIFSAGRPQPHLPKPLLSTVPCFMHRGRDDGGVPVDRVARCGGGLPTPRLRQVARYGRAAFTGRRARCGGGWAGP